MRRVKEGTSAVLLQSGLDPDAGEAMNDFWSVSGNFKKDPNTRVHLQ